LRVSLLEFILELKHLTIKIGNEKMTKNSKGFGAVEAILMLAVIVLIGVIGRYFWHSSTNSNTTSITPTSISSQPTSSTPKVSTKQPTVINTYMDAGNGWKIYTHKSSSSFSVQYPARYTADTGTLESTADTSQGHLLGTLDIDSWMIKDGQPASTSTCNFTGNESIPACAVKVEVSIFSKVTKNLSDWIKSFQSTGPTASTDITIDGQKAKKNFYKDDKVAGGHFTGYYYREGDKGVEFIVMPEDTKLASTAEKIVTSFKLN
jgi:hypothetical protein